MLLKLCLSKGLFEKEDLCHLLLFSNQKTDLSLALLDYMSKYVKELYNLNKLIINSLQIATEQPF